MSLLSPSATNGDGNFADQAAARALRRVELANDDIATAFDRAGCGLTAATILNSIEPAGFGYDTMLLIATWVIEAERETHRWLAHADRIFHDSEKRWRRDVAQDQIALDGIEPARHIQGEASLHWNMIRANRRIYCGNQCEDCGRSGEDVRLDGHHVSYSRYGYEELEDILMLCRACHDLRHGVVGKNPPV